MVQWFDYIVMWLNSFFYTPATRQLSYNRDKLCSELQNLSDKLFDYKTEMSFAIVREVVEMSKNVAMLEAAQFAKSEQDINLLRGRFQALSDLGHYLDMAIQSRKEEKKTGIKKQSREFKVQEIRRANNQAGLAI